VDDEMATANHVVHEGALRRIIGIRKVDGGNRHLEGLFPNSACHRGGEPHRTLDAPSKYVSLGVFVATFARPKRRRLGIEPTVASTEKSVDCPRHSAIRVPGAGTVPETAGPNAGGVRV